jgi:hypothetical protein
VKECTCALSMVSRYQKRISGPLLDRIDIHIEVPRVEYEKLTDERLGEPSTAIQARVEAARERQRRRFEGTGLMSNADMGPSEVRTFCQIDDAGKSLLRAAMHQFQMRVPSTRGACPGQQAGERPQPYHGNARSSLLWNSEGVPRILKPSRTIACPESIEGPTSRGATKSRRRTWRRRSNTGHGGRVRPGQKTGQDPNLAWNGCNRDPTEAAPVVAPPQLSPSGHRPAGWHLLP